MRHAIVRDLPSSRALARASPSWRRKPEDAAVHCRAKSLRLSALGTVRRLASRSLRFCGTVELPSLAGSLASSWVDCSVECALRPHLVVWISLPRSVLQLLVPRLVARRSSHSSVSVYSESRFSQQLLPPSPCCWCNFFLMSIPLQRSCSSEEEISALFHSPLASQLCTTALEARSRILGGHEILLLQARAPH